MSQTCSVLNVLFFFSFLEFAITFSFKDRIKPLEFSRYHSLKPSIFLLWSGPSARQVCITAATQTLFPSRFGSTTSWLPCLPHSCCITLVCLRKSPMIGCVKSLCLSDHVSSPLLLNFAPDWHFGWVKNYRLTILSSQCFKDNFPLSLSIQYKWREFTYIFTLRYNLGPNYDFPLKILTADKGNTIVSVLAKTIQVNAYKRKFCKAG